MQLIDTADEISTSVLLVVVAPRAFHFLVCADVRFRRGVLPFHDQLLPGLLPYWRNVSSKTQRLDSPVLAQALMTLGFATSERSSNHVATRLNTAKSVPMMQAE